MSHHYAEILSSLKASLSKVSLRRHQGRFSRLSEFLQRDLHVTPEAVDRIIKKYPQIASLNVEKNIAPTIAALRSVGIEPRSWEQLLLKAPQILAYSVEKNVLPKIRYLVELGIPSSEISAVIMKHPQMLGLSFESKLYPLCNLFKNFGLSDADIAKMIRKVPQILSYSIESHEAAFVFLENELGVSRSDVAKLVTRFPQVLGLRHDENVHRKITYFEEIGLSREQIAKIVCTVPQVLGLDVERNLKPKYEFLTSVLRGTADDLVKFPRYFTYSLERIRLRHLYLLHLHSATSRPVQLPAEVSPHKLPAEGGLLLPAGRKHVGLGDLLAFSDAKFAEKVAGTDLEHYEEFVLDLWSHEAEAAILRAHGNEGNAVVTE